MQREVATITHCDVPSRYPSLIDKCTVGNVGMPLGSLPVTNITPHICMQETLFGGDISVSHYLLYYRNAGSDGCDR